MKKIFLILCSLFALSILSAQTVKEALRYANQNFYGTARSSAMGGAFSSLGGDISVASTNPAGLAIFRSSTASITPGLRFSKVKAKGVKGETGTFVLPSLGFVFTTVGDDNTLKNWNFGIVYNQSANFNQKSNLVDNASSYSFLDEIAYDANHDSNGNLKPYQTEALRNYKKHNAVSLLPGMAYNTYLISPNKEGIYLSAVSKEELMNRTSVLDDTGSNGEIAFSVAGNYDNMLYFGATVGVQNINFEGKENYTEKLNNPTNESLLDVFYYDKYLHTRGAGINFKAGLIYRPTNALRLGVAVHTPTFFSLEDEYFYVMKSQFYKEPEEGKGTSFKQAYPSDSQRGIFEYEYRTPWKFTFGGSYIFGKKGLLSIDYDLIDYSSSKFSESNFDNLNKQIKNTYKMAGNLKVGAEIRPTNQLAFRAGYNYFGNIYSNKTNKEQKASQYSAGLGYRYNNVSIDASYQYYTQEHTTQYNDFSSVKDYNVNTIKLTIGFQF